MTTKLINAAIAGLSILSFLPVLAIDPLLDTYARVRGQPILQDRVNLLAGEIESQGRVLIESLQSILAAAPALCTTPFLNEANARYNDGAGLIAVEVQSPDNRTVCTVGHVPDSAQKLSEPIGIAGRDETITIVSEARGAHLILRVSQTFGTGEVAAYASLPFSAPGELKALLRPGSTARLSLTNGTVAVAMGDWAQFQSVPDDFIPAASFVGALPLRLEVAVPYGSVRADYDDAYAALLVLFLVIGALLSTLAYLKVRGVRWPQFELERAIRNGEIKPYYQPVVNLMTGRVSGCEVLCRWEMRDGSVRGPGSFIEYAETTGLGIAMTLSVMKQVKKDLSELCHDMPGFTVSINLFDKHFSDSRVVEDVRSIFGDSSIRYSQLVFEITERHPLDRIADAHEVIVGLHSLGARVAMDDTGTGHSNLAYLQTLGVDVLKIDRVFIDMILPGTTSVPVLDGLIRMARDLNTDVVAEGIETEEQLHYLRARGITEAQGYLFSPALRAEPFCRLVRALNSPRVGGQKPAYNSSDNPDAPAAISAA